MGDVTVVCHTENIEIVNRMRRRVQAEGGDTLQGLGTHEAAVHRGRELRARDVFRRAARRARSTFRTSRTRMALDEVRRWRKRYDQVFVETCPHYLTHDEDSDLGPLGKANPPFRIQGRR